ncbi:MULTISPECIES: hypothetical protein [unclassified Streptomyces]|uniref:hypothetical protein n=1 Tax=unclassified Streptomyces TaxID=2593676 RepID=UPI002DDB6FED|nr:MULTISPECIES: hypothetical protein [unclassified Streptomyces]WSD27934.1 hypothetical protein OHA26_33085 [Streptomyces sp. NBC_01751]WSF83602.1 hypothetical protein OIE70_11265 [Streptomyces sp. NBC_01744]WSJ50067.1 hypothetical protein OG243_11275 [Streptomyces sp. NBC_01318]
MGGLGGFGTAAGELDGEELLVEVLVGRLALMGIGALAGSASEGVRPSHARARVDPKAVPQGEFRTVREGRFAGTEPLQTDLLGRELWTVADLLADRISAQGRSLGRMQVGSGATTGRRLASPLTARAAAGWPTTAMGVGN